MSEITNTEEEQEQWRLLQQEIRTVANVHSGREQDKINEFVHAATAKYLSELELFRSNQCADPRLEEFLRTTTEGGKKYLIWMQWVAWNAGNLVALVDEPNEEDFLNEFVYSMLAYVCFRLLDDGLDYHPTFKEHHITLVGTLREAHPEHPVHLSCGLSMLVGMQMLQFSLKRLNDLGLKDHANDVGDWWEKVSAGVLSEHCAPKELNEGQYLAIIANKSVAYNMVLYSPFIRKMKKDIGPIVHSILHQMDELSQVVNDFGDTSIDGELGQVNAFTHQVYKEEDYPLVIRSYVMRMWSSVQQLPPENRGALAQMFTNAGVIT